ncbi:PREDICTED: protein RMD5 homolog A-like isoform X2 [Tarenaya hassleriana]|uniref:protein RMD5 homolog A-like isoform X1 n=1 Tax=Tarenaya hassleriana TaxID=28532 RepID=UPI00053CA3F9|nr:PREDICTED: protein RMD5 homolog A-like isoform X1 [Tarenaya hassleriana]XP_010531333.1 PREDICTED: protein RMD5 homolog A-like isoform X2 [Tarenaya hassleriana]
MELTSIKDAFDRVAKKQKLSYSKTQEVVDKLAQEIEKALHMIQEAPPDAPLDHKSIVSELKKKLLEIAPISHLEASQKEFNVALSKYPKALEKTLNPPDMSKAYRNVEFDTHTVNQIIANFFYREGMFEIGDCFIAETGEAECSARQSFMEMYEILEAMKKRDLGPALNWAVSNSEKLKQVRSDLEMKLRSLHFLEIVQEKNSAEALDYARKHIAMFAESCLPDIQKLMCSLLWNRKLDKSPYAEFLSPAPWNNAVKELTRQYCNLLGESYKSPLGVTIAAGNQALPPLLKYMNLMVNKKQEEWQTMEQLPIPVELSEEFQFHSVFVCPVSKEQSSDDNPPMMMSCGHVLCKQSINKMSKNASKSFKCPYCPSDIDATQCRPLQF